MANQQKKINFGEREGDRLVLGACVKITQEVLFAKTVRMVVSAQPLYPLVQCTHFQPKERLQQSGARKTASCLDRQKNNFK